MLVTGERRAAYFRRYYLAHREEILEKNRAWARAHPDRRRELRRLSRLKRERLKRERRRLPPACVDCGVPVVRAERCRRCYNRHRYRTDEAYRERRLAITRRARARRRGPARGGGLLGAAKGLREP